MGAKAPVTGLDANVLVYALDPSYPENKQLDEILFRLSPENRAAITPTIIHEAYHVLVFYQKIIPSDVLKRLNLVLRHPYIDFFNQTKRTCQFGLKLAEKYGLGGRDSLIIAGYLANGVPTMYTRDGDILKLGRVSWKGSTIIFKDPLEASD